MKDEKEDIDVLVKVMEAYEEVIGAYKQIIEAYKKALEEIKGRQSYSPCPYIYPWCPSQPWKITYSVISGTDTCSTDSESMKRMSGT